EQGIEGLAEYYAAWRVVPFERSIIDLLGELKQRHQTAFEKRGAIDFTELLLRVRDVLRDWPDVRTELQETIGALLVDEFQDTNRLQLEIVTLLAERREGAPRPVSMMLGERSGARSSEDLALPLQSAFLCIVGDRKQSIYEFRGADVSVFEVL